MTLDELIELEKKATPGPWGAPDSVNSHLIARTERDSNGAFIYIGDGQGVAYADDADGRFLIALRNLAPELLAVAKAAREFVGHDCACSENACCCHHAEEVGSFVVAMRAALLALDAREKSS